MTAWVIDWFEGGNIVGVRRRFLPRTLHDTGREQKRHRGLSVQNSANRHEIVQPLCETVTRLHRVSLRFERRFSIMPQFRMGAIS
jgi:hypothetical protein